MIGMIGRKNRFTKVFNRSTLFFLIAGFLFLAGFQDWLHNHPLMAGEQVDCPVFQLTRTVNFLPVVVSSLFVVLLVALFNSRHSDQRFKSRILFTSLGSRAPPFLC
jgi:hypothetical protein